MVYEGIGMYSALPPSAGFLWMIWKSASLTMSMRTSPSEMRGSRRWSTSCPPASLPPYNQGRMGERFIELWEDARRH